MGSLPQESVGRKAQKPRRKSLPVVTAADCRGCGACCRHVGHPMFTVCFELGEVGAEPAWVSLPEELKQYHRGYIAGLRVNAKSPDDDYGSPCYWLEPDGTCRHYEHRPEVCRDFEVGEESCLWHREQDRYRDIA
jgi:Fe-S-cluster containining protein